MSDEILWQVFADTGEPISWLMYRASKRRKKNEKSAEDTPSPES